MDDLISRQAAIDALNEMKIYRPLDSDRWVISDCLNKIVNLPSAQPTIDAEPVRRGKWKYVGVNTYDLLHGGRAYEPTYLCSLCEMVSESYVRLDEPIMPRDADYPNYCPNCGAKMEA